jgi:hypothetical protein
MSNSSLFGNFSRSLRMTIVYIFLSCPTSLNYSNILKPVVFAVYRVRLERVVKAAINIRNQ